VDCIHLSFDRGGYASLNPPYFIWRFFNLMALTLARGNEKLAPGNEKKVKIS